MKKYFSKLLHSKDLPAIYILSGLKLTYICASLILLYYIILQSTGHLGYAEKMLLRECIVYVGTSAGLSLAFGLLIDLYLKKNKK